MDNADIFDDLSFNKTKNNCEKISKSGTVEEVVQFTLDEIASRIGDEPYLRPDMAYVEDEDGIYHCKLDDCFVHDVFYLQLGHSRISSKRNTERGTVRFALTNPTVFEIFNVIEQHYRKIGCPPTDHRFFEGLVELGFSRDGSGLKIYTPFMGS